jgi:hypothetical protein
MTQELRPLSQLIGQGWELVSYSAGSDYNNGGGMMDCFLLRRQKQHKLLKVRRKYLGNGLVVRELDL